MVNNDEFVHKSVIASYRLYNSDEGCIKLKVETVRGKLDLECFVHSETSAQLYRCQFRNDDEVTVSFDFLTSNFDSRGMPLTLAVSNAKRKGIQKNPERADNQLGCDMFYIVEGRIIKLYPPNNPELAKHYNDVVIDCGIYLHADIPKPLIVKVGDYIKIQGRLDAHIIGKVEGKHER